MRSFMVSGVHRSVMRHLMECCDEASVAHWVQDELEAPSWANVHRRMQREGRRSKVNHPSDAQRRFEFPEPRTTTALKFK
jgi:hypothetical protein